MSSRTALVFALALICAAEASLLDGMVQDKPKNAAKAQSTLQASVEQEEAGEIQRPALLSGIGGIKKHEVIKSINENSAGEEDKFNDVEEQAKPDGEGSVQSDAVVDSVDQGKALENGHENIKAPEPDDDNNGGSKVDGDTQEDSKVVGHA